MIRLQFTVRQLLVVTAVVSVVLLFAVKWLPAFLVVSFWLAYIAGFVGAMYVTSAERPRIAVYAWVVLGALLVTVAVVSFRFNTTAASVANGVAPGAWWMSLAVSVVIGCFGLFAFYRALQAYSRAKYDSSIAAGEKSVR